ncbi:hypothetical protein SCLCIDRAFT_1208696 [Scleroderma citrinum Foug A]|uniref:Uncharacterized protein n=1 Tax=Scleroderma citrinum Foug A TaxID=1036808 RepID=A0A0C3AWC7_9AGAM|nr:hypothetical protein SCLCIDRAFT_1208696 [Scleroderma citrinum Foug A]
MALPTITNPVQLTFISRRIPLTPIPLLCGKVGGLGPHGVPRKLDRSLRGVITEGATGEERCWHVTTHQ